MIFKQNNGVSLWGKTHPGVCVSCSHNYHVTTGDSIKGFDTYTDAEDFYCKESKTDRFLFGSGKPFNS